MANTVREMLKAIYSKRIIEVTTLLDESPELLHELDRGTPMLSVSLFKSKDDISMELIRRGADIQALDKFGQSALMIALNSGKQKVAEELFNRGANTNVVAKSGATMLTSACSGKNRIKLVTRLFSVDNNIDVNYQTSGQRNTALMLAASNSDEAVMSLLLDKGADPYIKNVGKVDAFFYGDKDILPRLIAQKKLENTQKKMGKFKDLLKFKEK